MLPNLHNFTQIGKTIIAVGRNYKAHAIELGNVVPTTPLLFSKPTSAYIVEGQKIKIPEGCKCLHHEVELGIVINQKASRISASDAMKYVGGYTVSLDLTARDFQNDAKKAGNPWLLAKGFDTSCPTSSFIPANLVPDVANLELWCSVNGSSRQRGFTKDMIFTVPILIEYITKYFTLHPGDLILTGTPEGVSEVKSGDSIECGLKIKDEKVLTTVRFNVE